MDSVFVDVIITTTSTVGWYWTST